MPNIYKNNKLNIDLFLKEESLIQTKILQNILKNVYQNKIDLINTKHVNIIMHALKNKKPNIQINLPNNKSFIKAYNYAWIEDYKNIEKYNLILKSKLELPNNHIIEIISNTSDHSNYITKLNTKDFKLPLHVRTKKNGDKIILKGSNQTKKNKRYFYK